ncbi:MAG: hypothetical protein V1736_10220 [Pseudomonadota bacterium]
MKPFHLRETIFFILFGISILLPGGIAARTAYQYRDKDGAICFTDDPSTIPKESRKDVGIRELTDPGSAAHDPASKRQPRVMPPPEPPRARPFFLHYQFNEGNDLLTNLLDIDEEVYPQLYGRRIDRVSIMHGIEAIAGAVRKDMSKAARKDAKGQICCLLDRLTAMGFKYQSVRERERVVFLKDLLETRTTNCAGFSQTCIVLGERLSLPVRGVAIPCPRSGEFHMLTRYDNGKEQFDIEATARLSGLRYGDNRYMRITGAWKSPYFFRNLSKREVIGDYFYYLYYLARGHKRWDLAFECAARGYELAPESWWTNYMMSSVCLQRGEVDRAKKHTQKMLDVGYMAPPELLRQVGIDYPANRWFR